ncbi:hypothetical protein U9M48_025872 [Paspalum notatum var. saurae]|uniref:Uncharacterized protein n=1 Tax=Paspalum notatum var. saurae TaxID=547442 RepID=A0AAQ3TRN4_PASNO
MAGVAAAVPAKNGDDDLRTSWPEVVGWVALNAAFKISSDRPDLSIMFFMVDTPLPIDYEANRVIIIFDGGNVVVRTPVIG